MNDEDFRSVVRWLLYGTIAVLLLIILAANIMITFDVERIPGAVAGFAAVPAVIALIWVAGKRRR